MFNRSTNLTTSRQNLNSQPLCKTKKGAPRGLNIVLSSITSLHNHKFKEDCIVVYLADIASLYITMPTQVSIFIQNDQQLSFMPNSSDFAVSNSMKLTLLLMLTIYLLFWVTIVTYFRFKINVDIDLFMNVAFCQIEQNQFS